MNGLSILVYEVRLNLYFLSYDFILLFPTRNIYLFNKYFMSAYNMLGSGLGMILVNMERSKG